MGLFIILTPLIPLSLIRRGGGFYKEGLRLSLTLLTPGKTMGEV
jgi:hypothetical protein